MSKSAVSQRTRDKLNQTHVIPGTELYEEVNKFEIKQQGRALDGLIRLRAQLREEVPQRTFDSTLLIATWNIRELAERSMGGERLDESYIYIAEVLSRFDLVAVQEIRDIRCLRYICSLMGPSWRFMITDVSGGSGGNKECLTYVYDSRKVEFDGLAGEVVLTDKNRKYLLYPHTLRSLLEELRERGFITEAEGKKLEQLLKTDEPEKSSGFLQRLNKVTPKKLKGDKLSLFRRVVKQHALATRVRQIDRTPFICGFKSGFLKFQICTVHAHFGEGEKDKDRVDEIRTLAQVLSERSQKEQTNMILLGDMNIFSPTKGKDKSGKSINLIDPALQALHDEGFEMSDEFCKSNAADTESFDQIAYKAGGPFGELLFQPTGKEGAFDFFKSVFRIGDEDKYDESEVTFGKKLSHDKKYKQWRTFQMSDHNVKWFELKTDLVDDFLPEMSRLVNFQIKHPERFTN